MNKLSKNASNRIALYLLTICLFAGCIVIAYGIRVSINRYYTLSIQTSKDAKWNLLYTNLNAALDLSSSSLNEKATDIQRDIKYEQIDMKKLKESLMYNRYYNDFDLVLRKHLQGNIFTNHYGMDPNRNNIFVLSNGNIVSGFSHSNLRGIPFVDGCAMSNNNVRDYVSEFYNTELSEKAIDMIEEQSEGLIVWQKTPPSDPNMKKYTSMSYATVREIYETYGIDGFESFTFLVPEYITEFGNIFGEYDTSKDAGKNNKIVLVQKINLKDYLEEFASPSFFDWSDINHLRSRYEYMKIMISVFEIILYISILSYVIFVMFSINRILESSENYDSGTDDT